MGKNKKKLSKEGIQIGKNEDFAKWYKEVLEKSQMIDYYDVSGCYVLRPWAYNIWQKIQNYLNGLIEGDGVQNCYFPLFVTQEKLKKEEDNFEGFKAEVAWVTHSGDKKMAEPIAIRPTSETVMYPYFGRWIRSHRDLPLRLNQWCNIVRWEFSNPTPFIRTREFLWQEGHSCFANKNEADKEVIRALNFYKQTYEELLAIPVTRGFKTEKEKFPGGLFTTTVEAFVEQNGRSIQAATSHSLGQGFAKMFDITYELDDKKKNKDEKKQDNHVWQNSWGFTTRSIGAMILIHGDDHGLVLPPRVAPIQVVIVPIFKSKFDSNILKTQAQDFAKELKKAGIRVTIDDKEEKTPGWKYAHYELKGVPIRIELGPKDIEKKTVVLSRRDTRKKIMGTKFEDVVPTVKKLIDEIHTSMFNKALQTKNDHRKTCLTWEDFMKNLDAKNVCLVPFCLEKDCELEVKEKSKTDSKLDQDSDAAGAAKSLCIPFIQDKLPEGCKCFNPNCKKAAKRWCLFGRSY